MEGPSMRRDGDGDGDEEGMTKFLSPVRSFLTPSHRFQLPVIKYDKYLVYNGCTYHTIQGAKYPAIRRSLSELANTLLLFSAKIGPDSLRSFDCARCPSARLRVKLITESETETRRFWILAGEAA